MATQWSGVADPTPARALECVRELVGLDDSSSTPLTGLMILCRFGADLAEANAAGHIHFQRDDAVAHWCVWTRDSAARPTLQRQQEQPLPGGQDWWMVSATRRLVYDELGAGHLAELPLRIDASSPSLIVLRRTQRFDDDDSEALAASRWALLLIETLIDRLFPRLATSAVSDRDYPVVLTAREHEVLEMLSQGLLARSIATRLDVSERTVHKHLGSVYRKLDAHDRLLAVRRAQSLGLLTTTPPREPVPTG
jgi:DNA-binding CsgD family transcriptional regulator